MTNGKPRLTLDRIAKYQIEVPGHLDKLWSDFGWKVTISYSCGSDEMPVTILTGHFDQAALHGLLRHLYSLGLPLISAKCIDAG
jgi:hypothetical protein